jgi:hypothetical protein
LVGDVDLRQVLRKRGLDVVFAACMNYILCVVNGVLLVRVFDGNIGAQREQLGYGTW